MPRLLTTLAGLLVAAVAAADPPSPPPSRPADGPDRTDPKARPAPAELAGSWTGEQAAPGGDVTRRHTLRFLDADTAVWTFAQSAPGVRASITLRGRYELADGELRFRVTERYAGGEKFPPRADEKEPRVYRFVWDGPRKTGFTLTSVTASPDSPWATTVLRKTADTPAAAEVDPLTPKVLLAIDRTIKKQPRYETTPLYLLLAVGPDSADRVWVVLDGTKLYVDANGNGDLTEPGEQFFALAIGGGANPRNPFFQVSELVTPGGKHTDFIFSGLRLVGGGTYAKVGLRVSGKTLQLAGLTDLQLTETPAAARVLPFGSRVVTAQRSHTMPAVPEVGKAVDFRVRVGTPGVGAGSFVAYGSEDVPEATSPVAEFLFPAATAGGAAQRVVVPLTQRCCGDQFYAPVTAPEGTRPGLDSAALVLRFPNCPWGTVAPAASRVDVMPKER
jgi:hypothetical protein